MNAIVQRHEHILHHSTVLKELFPPNSFIVANKRAKNLLGVVARADPYNIKTDLLGPTDHIYKKYGLNATLVILFLRKTFLYVLLKKLN